MLIQESIMQSISMLITPERISISNQLPSKKRVLQTLSCLLIQNNTLDKNEVFTALFNREKLGSTHIGNGVAIPHARLENCNKPTGAFLKVTPGLLDFTQNPQDIPVDLFFGLIVPAACTQSHLNVLAELAKFFRDKQTCEDLRSSKEPYDIYRLLVQQQPRTAIV